MYDARNEPREFIGEERAEAVAMACEFFDAAEEALEIMELKPGEVYGLANRAVVVAVPRDRPPPQRERGRGDGPGRGGRDRNERGGRGRSERGGRERSERGGRDRSERGGRDRSERGGRERSERPRQPPPRAEEPTEPSVGTLSGTVGDVGAFVCGVIERMDLGPFEIGESGEGGLLVLQVGGAAAPELAGSDGRAVDALQLLANQAAGRLSEDPPRVVLDVEGDVEARESRLTKLAQRVARRAQETGRVVRLDPMNGKDRRIIHLALRDEEDVATMSSGEGRYRQVVVVPEGAPEFEEAQRESEAAAERSGA
jgi:predicted RNA-binding protein Jag